MNTKQAQLENQINHLKAELLALGRLRPGTLSAQARARGHGGYFQVTCTRRGRSCCAYVRPDYVPVIRAEITNYQRYRELTRQWLDLELALSQLKLRASRAQSIPSPSTPPPAPTPPANAAH